MINKTIHPSLKVLSIFFLSLSIPLSLLYEALKALGIDTIMGIGLLSIYYTSLFFIALETLRRYFNHKYVFQKEKMIIFHGIVSPNLEKSNCEYRDIIEVKAEQGILGRLLDYGDIFISMASFSDKKIVIKYVDDIQNINKEIIQFHERKPL